MHACALAVKQTRYTTMHHMSCRMTKQHYHLLVPQMAQSVLALTCVSPLVSWACPQNLVWYTTYIGPATPHTTSWHHSRLQNPTWTDCRAALSLCSLLRSASHGGRNSRPPRSRSSSIMVCSMSKRTSSVRSPYPTHISLQRSSHMYCQGASSWHTKWSHEAMSCWVCVSCGSRCQQSKGSRSLGGESPE